MDAVPLEAILSAPKVQDFRAHGLLAPFQEVTMEGEAVNHDVFLPGVPVERCLAALAASDGNEVASGKLASPESSAALAVNAFGWFIERPDELPALPGLEWVDWPATRVDVERQMRFPWRGGRHPWLDAAIETETYLIGVESKRYEPFRDTKQPSFSDAYERHDWGQGMWKYDLIRRGISVGSINFRYLDVAQLIKHAYGLRTEAGRLGLKPVLFYIFAEPTERNGREISAGAHDLHRNELFIFQSELQTAGQDVLFAACSYREWFETWQGEAKDHASRLVSRFTP
ncbi:hypothetical protein K3163_02405 [Qipengyuania sp. 1NDW9]|uniref:PGN_0703 family putative restriction endonuclease n=1 Tax=Qipengyuania xiapuensis TaxID=2867236 RepID=UPI001C87F1F1|nr:hypothetical protein [Qipengyuania xiapuensis]MBX7492057.1 hypothetical protein [Qipengyuania xiapuensis]